MDSYATSENTKELGIEMYTLKPYAEAGSFEDLAIARQRLVWWLATHGMTNGLIYKESGLAGKILHENGIWIWSPKGTRTTYKVNPTNGNLMGKIE